MQRAEVDFGSLADVMLLSTTAVRPDPSVALDAAQSSEDSLDPVTNVPTMVPPTSEM